MLIIKWKLPFGHAEQHHPIRRIRTEQVELVASIYQHDLSAPPASRKDRARAVGIHGIGSSISDRMIVPLSFTVRALVKLPAPSKPSGRDCRETFRLER